VLQGLANKPQPVTCANLDPDECGSGISFKTAYEEPVLKGAAHKTQNVKCATVD
jgi:hypothetical protein